MSWSARQYTAFERERTRPVRDLVAAIETNPVRRAVDLGCGPGNSTEVLQAAFPHATVQGVDSSADMIEAARKRLPDGQFSLADVQSWNEPDTYDVVLSNAALQWVPDHASLMPRLMRCVVSGGSLAIQVPDNLEEPAHRLMREIAAKPRFATKLAKAAGAREPRRPADWYYALLKPHATRVDVWLTVYHHVLAGGTDAVVEWFKGSGLRPFLAPLDDAEQQDYLAQYRAALVAAYPTQPDGSVLLPFPRLFIVATR
jgi:trans-aconitate 2-methyltransferase